MPFKLPYRRSDAPISEALAHGRGQTPEIERAGIRTRIVSAYDNAIVRLYCLIRFQIINLRILDELEQYVPSRGRILDLGCGFGLFTFYFLLRRSERRLYSIDLDARRIEMARQTAARLGVQDRCKFRVMNVLDYPFDVPCSAIVLIDIVHHVPVEAAPRILEQCHAMLEPGGVLILKEVEARPRWKAMFTWILDKLMDWRTPVHYYHADELTAYLKGLGFEVHTHTLRDVLPYSHILYVCRKPA